MRIGSESLTLKLNLTNSTTANGCRTIPVSADRIMMAVHKDHKSEISHGTWIRFRLVRLETATRDCADGTKGKIALSRFFARCWQQPSNNT